MAPDYMSQCTVVRWLIFQSPPRIVICDAKYKKC